MFDNIKVDSTAPLTLALSHLHVIPSSPWRSVLNGFQTFNNETILCFTNPHKPPSPKYPPRGKANGWADPEIFMAWCGKVGWLCGMSTLCRCEWQIRSSRQKLFWRESGALRRNWFIGINLSEVHVLEERMIHCDYKSLPILCTFTVQCTLKFNIGRDTQASK